MAITGIDHATGPVGPDTVPGPGARPARQRRPQVSGPEFGRRVLILAFGLVQLLIGLRIVLLVLDMPGSNSLVAGILDLSQTLVGPFEAILSSDALHAPAGFLDLAAILALLVWTILEIAVLRVIGILGREPA